MKRNQGKHTDESLAIFRILNTMQHGWMNKSGMAYAAYPDYNFKAPQGAAFSVAKIASKMYKDGLIDHRTYGYEITLAGRAKLRELQAQHGQGDVA